MCNGNCDPDCPMHVLHDSKSGPCENEHIDEADESNEEANKG